MSQESVQRGGGVGGKNATMGRRAGMLHRKQWRDMVGDIVGDIV